MNAFQRSIMRLRGFLRKEALQICRDPSSIALALVMPVVLLFLFGFGVSLDVKDVPIAIVLDDRGPEARDLAERFTLSNYFEPVLVDRFDEARQLLDRREVDAIVQVQSDFSDRLAHGAAVPVQIIVNGTDSNLAQLVKGYTLGVVGLWSQQRAARGLSTSSSAVTIQQRVWFNDAVNSTHFLVPGLVALVMTLIGVLLTALVIAREWERGTMEAILATPLRVGEIMVGKLLPYFVLGMMGLGLSVGLGRVMFGVPFRGSPGVYLLLSTLFLLASLGLGLFVSAAARVQFVAAQVSIIVGFLPAFFLSGLLFDLESTPWPIQAVSHLIPARYFVSASHTIFLAGDVWSVLQWDALFLGLMAVVLIALARSRLGQRLEG